MNLAEQIKWFQDARFGLFLHWGLYSVLAGEYRGQRMEYIGEWIMSRYRIPYSEYEKLAGQFNPTAFDADEWVRTAKRAGMRYIVYTAKHHEGFAMYHSHADPYNIVDATPYHRDPLKELAEACQRHGLKLGLYYSQDLDWHEPDGGDPGPQFPLNNNEMSWGNDWDFPNHAAKRFERFFEKKVKPQVKELLTEYGEICLVWFDCPLTINREQSQELWSWVRQFQPACLVNTRLGNNLGDYGSMGDNQVPVGQVEGIWETPATLNDTWGYKSFDHNWKSPIDTLNILAGLAGKNVNYLLNIGPQPDGRLPVESVDILNRIGDWMELNGEAVHNTRQSPFPYDFDWGSITSRPGKPARLYLILKDVKDKKVGLNGLRSLVHSARLLSEPQKLLPFEQTPEGTLSITLPQVGTSLLPVVALDLEGEIEVDPRLVEQPDGKIQIPASAAIIHLHPDSALPNSEPVEALSWADTDVAPARSQTSHTPFLDRTGSLMNWLDPRDWVEWEICIPTAGAYAVEVITTSIGHSTPWRGGHRIRLETESSALECVLLGDKPDLRPETRCYPRAASSCGAIRFNRSGCQKLSLKPLEIQPNNGDGLVLIGVRLERLPS